MEKFRESKSIFRGGFRWRVSGDCAGCFNEEIIEKITALGESLDKPKSFTKESGGLVKNNKVRLVFFSKLQESDKAVYVKKYKSPQGIFNGIRFLFLKSKALSEWLTGNEIIAKSILAIIPVAAGEKRRFGLLQESFFVTARVENSEPLNEYVSKNLYRLGLKKKRDLILNLASFTRRMHEAGIFHKDFHSGNILIRKLGDEPPRLYLIDYYKAKIRKRISANRRIVNLAQLGNYLSGFASRSNILRFIKTYFREDADFRKNRRVYLSRIAREISRIRGRRARKNRKRLSVGIKK